MLHQFSEIPFEHTHKYMRDNRIVTSEKVVGTDKEIEREEYWKNETA